MLGLFKRGVAVASRLDIVPPNASAGRSGVAVATVVRDEVATIADWIKFHRLAGVQRFFIYDNGSTDGTADAALAAGLGDVTVIPWRLPVTLVRPPATLHQQELAYAHAICTFGGEVRWMALIDVDEYLFPATTATLDEALKPLEAFANISIPWSMFGVRSSQTEAVSAPWSFTRRARKPHGVLLNFKCIVDPCDVTRVSVHKFWTRSMGAESVNAVGLQARYKRRGTPEFLASTAIRLHHYCAVDDRDIDALLARGAVSGMSKSKRSALLHGRAAAILADEIEDRSAINFLQRSGGLP